MNFLLLRAVDDAHAAGAAAEDDADAVDAGGKLSANLLLRVAVPVGAILWSSSSSS